MAEEPTTMTEFKAPELPAMPFDELRAVLREGYSTAINDIMDGCMANVLLPDDQAALALDAAQFMVFAMAIKTVGNRRQEPTRKNIMAAYWPIEKAIKGEVPRMLNEFVDELKAQGVVK